MWALDGTGSRGTGGTCIRELAHTETRAPQPPPVHGEPDKVQVPGTGWAFKVR